MPTPVGCAHPAFFSAPAPHQAPQKIPACLPTEVKKIEDRETSRNIWRRRRLFLELYFYGTHKYSVKNFWPISSAGGVNPMAPTLPPSPGGLKTSPGRNGMEGPGRKTQPDWSTDPRPPVPCPLLYPPSFAHPDSPDRRPTRRADLLVLARGEKLVARKHPNPRHNAPPHATSRNPGFSAPT